MDSYSPEDPIVLIIVKEIGEYVDDYRQQVFEKIVDKLDTVNLKIGE